MLEDSQLCVYHEGYTQSPEPNGATAEKESVA